MEDQGYVDGKQQKLQEVPVEERFLRLCCWGFEVVSKRIRVATEV